MPSRLILPWAFLLAAFAFSQDARKPTAVPVVSVEPACPEWRSPAVPGQRSLPPHITVRYNPNAPGARLTSAQSVSLFLANVRPNPAETTTMPLTRAADGTWQTEFDAQPFTLMMFFFKDEQNRTDNNRGEYWDMPICRDGEPFSMAISERASTYGGRLIAPGIQRAPDLARAIEILKDGLKRKPADYGLYFSLWNDELKAGGESRSAYQQVSGELDAFITSHGSEPDALRQISDFVAFEHQKLLPGAVERFRQAVTALPETAQPAQLASSPGTVSHSPSEERFRADVRRTVSDILADFDFRTPDSEQDPKRQVEGFLAFAGKYPDNIPFTGIAYARAFQDEKEMNDTTGAEAVFDKWAAFDGENRDPLVAMAHFYVDHKMKLDRAVQLLNAAAALSAKGRSGPPKSYMFLELGYGAAGDAGKIAFLRGQANLLLNNLRTARTDLEAAAKAMPDKPDVLYALGQVREKMGDNTQALDAYLAAASAPYQESGAPREAYERMFLAQNLGTKDDADQKLFTRIAANARIAAAQYTPMPLDRPAPKFTFTDLAGNSFDNKAAQGKPTVLSFWSVWCGPCVPELPAFQDFQKQHPDVNLLAVAIGNKPEDVKALLSSRKLNTLRVAIRNDWPQEFGVNEVPTTIVIDRFGHVQFVHVGQLADVAAILRQDLAALPTPN
jgi:thiol-disulfide isomerase/thioredoxin